MKKIYSFIVCLTLLSLSTTAQKVTDKIRTLSAGLTHSETNHDLKGFLSYYSDDVISMCEYQPTMYGISDISIYYREIFQRQHIRSFQRTAEEFITLKGTVIEIGTFKKELTDADTRNGKYWNIWAINPDGSIKLKGEVIGYFHPVKDPQTLTVKLQHIGQSNSNKDVPLELRAYSALNADYVRLKDGNLRSDFYTTDAKYMPSQEPTVSGLNDIRPYMVEHSVRGNITFDSLDLFTTHYEYSPGYVLEYSEVRVKWTSATTTGRTQGKGVRIWKRQPDGSIKIFRQIGTHDLIN